MTEHGDSRHAAIAGSHPARPKRSAALRLAVAFATAPVAAALISIAAWVAASGSQYGEMELIAKVHDVIFAVDRAADARREVLLAVDAVRRGLPGAARRLAEAVESLQAAAGELSRAQVPGWTPSTEFLGLRDESLVDLDRARRRELLPGTLSYLEMEPPFARREQLVRRQLRAFLLAESSRMATQSRIAHWLAAAGLSFCAAMLCLMALGSLFLNRAQRETDAMRASMDRAETDARLLFEASPDVLLHLSLSGEILSATGAVGRVLGITADALTGRSWESLAGAAGGIGAGQILEENPLDNLASARESLFRHPLGPERWIEWTAHRVSSVPRILVIARDVTRRHRLEAALRETHENLERKVAERTAALEASMRAVRSERARIEQLFEAATVGVAYGRPQGSATFVNTEFRRIVGLAADPGPQTNGNWLAPIFPEGVPGLGSPSSRDSLNARLDPREVTIEVEGRPPIPALVGGAELETGELAVFLLDLSPLREAQTETRNATARMEVLENGAGFGIWDWDLDTNRVYRSPGSQRIFGGNPGLRSGEPPLLDLVHPEDRDYVNDAFLTASKDSVDFAIEYRIRHLQDGGARWILSRGSAVLGPDGKAHRFIGLHIDVTENKRNAEALSSALADLQSAHERLSLAQEAAGIGLFDWNIQTNQAFCSDFYFRLHGLPPGSPNPDYEGWLAMVHPDDRAESRRHMETALAATGLFSHEFRVVWPDQSVHWLIGLGRVSRDETGQPSRLLGVNLDVTESRRQREAVEAALERHEFFAESLGSIVWSTNGDGSGIRFNQRWFLYTGLDPELPVRAHVRSVIHPADIEHVDAMWQHSLATGEHYEADFRLKRSRDGAYRWNSSRAFARRNAAGAIIEWVGSITDIDDQKRAEEVLRRSQDELEALVRDRTAKLDAALKTLEQTAQERLENIAEKEVLLKEIHHRVKNNLQVVSSLLHMQRQFVTDAFGREMFRESENRVLSMALVHENLYQSTNLAKVNLRTYLERIVANLASSYSRPDIHCQVLAESEVALPAEVAIPTGLLVNEMVSNAFKHAFPSNSGTITVILRRMTAGLQIEIRDTGVGLPVGFNLPAKESLGMQLVENLAIQIEASVCWSSGEGASFQVVLPGVFSD